MNCLICDSPTKTLFSKVFLFKYDIKYFRCPSCDFIQTEKPYWLTEAYQEAITKPDIGLLNRNLLLIEPTTAIIHRFFKAGGRFLDYGGGYGVFVRLARDRGYDFYLQDPYCKNIFAEHFAVEMQVKNKFELLTSFEVFEHMPDPVEEIIRMLDYSDNILFSTELHPQEESKLVNWWYLGAETGQHVALWSRESIRKLANRFSLQSYSNGHNLHLLTKKKISEMQFKLLSRFNSALLYNKTIGQRASLLTSDYNKVKNELIAENDEIQS